MRFDLDSSLADDDLKLATPPPLTKHPAAVYLSGLGEGSRRTIRYSLNCIAKLLTSEECDALTLDWSKLRYCHTAAVRAALMERFAPVTANKMLSALRRVLKEAYRLDLMEATDYTKAVDLPNIDAQPETRGRALTEAEIAALLKTCGSQSAIDVRDAAIIVILRGTGIRRAELVKLELNDFNPSLAALEVRKSKRGKSRRVYLPTEASAFVERWLDVRGAGHASPITTAKYDRRGEETKRKAVQSLSIPQL